MFIMMDIYLIFKHLTTKQLPSLNEHMQLLRYISFRVDFDSEL